MAALHYEATQFLLFWHHEQNAPRRKDLHEHLDQFALWHPALNSLHVEEYSRLSTAMSEIGPGTLDELVALLGQLKAAARSLHQQTPHDRGGTTNLVTERHGTAHGQLVVSLIQRIEGGAARGEIGSQVRVTGGPGGALVRVGSAVCAYATGEDHEDSIRHKARCAVPIWSSLKVLDDQTPAKAAELAKLMAL